MLDFEDKRDDEKMSFLSRCTATAGHFHRSNTQANELRKLQKAAKGKTQRIPTYCKTRFGSLHKMIRALAVNSHFIQQVYSDCPLTHDDWLALPFLDYYLAPFQSSLITRLIMYVI